MLTRATEMFIERMLGKSHEQAARRAKGHSKVVVKSVDIGALPGAHAGTRALIPSARRLGTAHGRGASVPARWVGAAPPSARTTPERTHEPARYPADGQRRR